MEVEEETTSNHPEEPVAVESTTVINETLIGNTTSTDKESEKEMKELISESNTLSVSVPKSDDTEASVMTEEVVHCRNTDSAAALSGGVENSVVIESVNVVEDAKDVDDGAVKEFDVPSDYVAAVECGGSEVPCTVNVVGEISGIQNDLNEGDEKETVEEEEGDTNIQLEGNELKDESKSDGGVDVQLEDVEHVQEVVGSDVRSDGEDVQVENIDNVQGEEAVTEEQVVEEAAKEEEIVADKGDESITEAQLVKEATKEEEMVADKGDESVTEATQFVEEAMKEEEVVADKGDESVTEVTQLVEEAMKEEEIVADKVEIDDVKQELKKEDDKTVDGVAENDEEDKLETEKSLETEMVADKSLNTEIETEKSLDTEMVAEKSLDTEMETEKSLCTEIETERPSDNDIETERSVDTEMETEKSVDTEKETEKSVDTEMETEKSVDTEMENEEEENLADDEKVTEAENETESSTKGGGGKRKRGGKTSKATPKSSAKPRRTMEEDVCFICFDGGDLVLCDRRNCPKAYHPSCVNRDEAFFQSKGSWNCGWHLCSYCEKKADYMCYTCTFSLCKACTKTSIFYCVREKEKKGFCEACIEPVMSIEKEENQGNLNFDDNWVHLFKDYWTETKEKHNLTLTELEQARSLWKGSGKHDINDDNGSGSDNPPENIKTRKSKRNTKKHKSNKENDSATGTAAENPEWVSEELLEFVTHMRNGDSSVISQYEVQDLLLEYIKRNKLRDPNRKSQIICDARLENLFGKPRVAHIEMLKLLESHFLVKEDTQTDDFQGSVVDTDISPVDDKDKKRKGRKKNDKRGPQSNREDYAAIDTHNISLIYLRRKLVEDLLDDMDRFDEIVVGTFVRIRISGVQQKQDMYRLVQVTGTSEAAWYTLSKRTTCTMLEILNLDKTETISIDSISNQDFMEDECKRLRQSIKCGLISRLTVGDVLDKAMKLQAVRVNDWFETEIVRLNHLRDRASDLGRKKELRECVEKLNVLKTPEERARRLEEFPVIHDDPTMDPDHESEEDTDPDDKKQELYKRSDSFRFNRRGKDQFSPRGDYTSKDSWSGTPRGSSGRSQEFSESWSGTPRGSSGKTNFTESWPGTPQSSSSKSYEFTKNQPNRSFSIKAEDATTSSFKMRTEIARDPFVQQPIVLEKPSVALPSIAAESAPKINETEKIWHYKDPSEKIQGPFSMVQLRKWSKNGYFPVGLKIWRKSDKEDDSVLLTDALEGKFAVVNQRSVSQDGHHGAQISSHNPASDSRHEPANFPSPTPNKGAIGWAAGQTGPLTGPGSPSPHLIACGNKDGNLSGSIGVSTLQPHDPSNNPASVAAAVAPQVVDPTVQYPVQPSQLGQAVASPDSNMQPQMVQSVSGQNPQGWPQNMQMNPSMTMAGLQPLAYNQWTGAPNMVQNPVGNFMPAPQEQWAQQFPYPVNQPNMQQQQPTQPLQPNVNWGAMVANPNMGWVGPNPGNLMNWAPMVQGPQVTGTVDPSWMMQAGWVPQPVQGVMPNQSWVATPQVPVAAGNGNPGWVGPVPPVNNQVAPGAGWVAPNQVPTNMNPGWVSGPGNQTAPVPNQGWVPPSGNQSAPVQNQGWVPPPGNQGATPPGNTNQNRGSRNRGGNWGGNDYNRGNFSGQRKNRGFGYGGNRSFNNKQDSFNRDDGPNDKEEGGSTQKDSGSVPGDSGKPSDQ